MEELLDLLGSFLGQADNLVLFIDNKVSGLFLLDSHDGIHLGKFRQVFATL